MGFDRLLHDVSTAAAEHYGHNDGPVAHREYDLRGITSIRVGRTNSIVSIFFDDTLENAVAFGFGPEFLTHMSLSSARKAADVLVLRDGYDGPKISLGRDGSVTVVNGNSRISIKNSSGNAISFNGDAIAYGGNSNTVVVNGKRISPEDEGLVILCLPTRFFRRIAASDNARYRDASYVNLDAVDLSRV